MVQAQSLKLKTIPKQKTNPTRKSSLSSPRRTHAIWRTIFFLLRNTGEALCVCATPHWPFKELNQEISAALFHAAFQELIGSCSAKYGGVIQADPKKNHQAERMEGATETESLSTRTFQLGVPSLNPKGYIIDHPF